MSGKAIRKARLRVDKTQAEIAKMLGLDPKTGNKTISGYENNTQKPSIERAFQLKEILDITLDEIYGEED